MRVEFGSIFPRLGISTKSISEARKKELEEMQAAVDAEYKRCPRTPKEDVVIFTTSSGNTIVRPGRRNREYQ